jgi:hypothetical protein
MRHIYMRHVTRIYLELAEAAQSSEALGGRDGDGLNWALHVVHSGHHSGVLGGLGLRLHDICAAVAAAVSSAVALFLYYSSAM